MRSLRLVLSVAVVSFVCIHAGQAVCDTGCAFSAAGSDGKAVPAADIFAGTGDMLSEYIDVHETRGSAAGTQDIRVGTRIRRTASHPDGYAWYGPACGTVNLFPDRSENSDVTRMRPGITGAAARQFPTGESICPLCPAICPEICGNCRRKASGLSGTGRENGLISVRSSSVHRGMRKNVPGDSDVHKIRPAAEKPEEQAELCINCLIPGNFYSSDSDRHTWCGPAFGGTVNLFPDRSEHFAITHKLPNISISSWQFFAAKFVCSRSSAAYYESCGTHARKSVKPGDRHQEDRLT